MKKPVVAMLGLAVAAVAFSATSSQAQMRTRIGTLSCNVAPGVGLVLGSRKQVDCIYTSARGGYREHYSGAVGRLGVDIGFTDGGRLAWAVFAPSRGGPGALAGTYVGASAEATVGAGVGANVLVGGFDRSVSLQPVSVGIQRGANLAVAASSLQLDSIGPVHRGRRHHRHG